MLITYNYLCLNIMNNNNNIEHNYNTYNTEKIFYCESINSIKQSIIILLLELLLLMLVLMVYQYNCFSLLITLRSKSFINKFNCCEK